MKANCYKCIHRGCVPGDAHSCCHHPSLGEHAGDMFGAIQLMINGKAAKAAIELNIRANAHGVRSGWFLWPANFDPVWLENCDGYTPQAGGVMHIIRSTTEKDLATGHALYWNNEDGWVDRQSATIFTQAEVAKYMWLPLGGEWVEV